MSSSAIIASHYNARPNSSIEQRKQSPIYKLRAFNNWVKSVLFDRYVKKNDKVIDIAAGKGGDLRKWKLRNVASVMIIDIAENSVHEAERRYNEMKMQNRKLFIAKFVTADCFRADLTEIVSGQLQDLCSIQFAIHYAFESEQQIRHLLSNVANVLVDGGYLIGTVPDADWITKELKKKSAQEQSQEQSQEIGNDVYRIKMNSIMDQNAVYGKQYAFFLRDAVDCLEYIVPFDTLVKLAKEYNLHLVEALRFDKLYEMKMEQGRGEMVDLYKRNVKSQGGEYIPSMKW